jgi:hypothetical protein
MEAVIRALVSAYVSGEISRETFEDWFIPATWDDRKLPDPHILRLVREIRHSLAEFSRGDISEESLKNDFQALVGPEPVILMGGEIQYSLRRGLAKSRMVGGQNQVSEVHYEAVAGS